jgi:hypothetical protein
VSLKRKSKTTSANPGAVYHQPFAPVSVFCDGQMANARSGLCPDLISSLGTTFDANQQFARRQRKTPPIDAAVFP